MKQSNSHKTITNPESVQNGKNFTQTNKKQIDYIKILKSMRLEEDLRRIRNFKVIQKNIKQGREQISQIEQQLQKVEQKIVQKKKQIIQKHIDKINQKKKQRQQFQHQTNKVLNEIKQKNQEKKKNMQQLVKQFQQKQTQKYQKTLKQRVNRYRNPINFQEIKSHQKKYIDLKLNEISQSKVFHQNIKKKQSLRVKSQIGSRYQNQFENLSIDHKSRLDERIKDQYREAMQNSQLKKVEVLKLIEKRNQYGNRVQKERKNVRVKTQANHEETKRQKESREFWEKINEQNQSLLKVKKPKLDTNLPKITLRDYAKLSLRKISQDPKTTDLQKLQKLKSMQHSFISQNNPQSLQIISEISLMKADLYLKF